MTQPTSTEINESESFALSVVADGGEPLSYQWYKDGVAIDGATEGLNDGVAWTGEGVADALG